MTIHDIPEVVFAPHSHKFIVAMLSEGESTKTVIRAQPPQSAGYHADIAKLLARELESAGIKASVEVLGGGSVQERVGTLVLGGASTVYGAEPDREGTARMVRAAFPEWNVVVE
ncbi:MAG: hypothetical protein RLZZ324_459 [Candidatus Parcubacteria bacterium]|jgi:hypothetical protein